MEKVVIENEWKMTTRHAVSSSTNGVRDLAARSHVVLAAASETSFAESEPFV